MAAFEVIALDTATPQLRAPGASDTYTFPRAVELPLGTANGVLYLNGSKVVTSGSGLVFDSAGNLGLGVTPSAWRSGARAFQSGANGYLTLWEQTNGSVNLGFAVYENGANTFAYTTTGDPPTLYSQLSGAHKWFTALSGTAGNAISFSQVMTLDASGNLGLGTSSFGTSAAGVLSIGNGTEPSTGPANTVQVYSVDLSAGNTIPAVYCEGSGVTGAGITNVTVTHKIAIKVNGTVYYLLATTNAT